MVKIVWFPISMIMNSAKYQRHFRTVLALLSILILYTVFKHIGTISYLRAADIHETENQIPLKSCTIPKLELWPTEFKQFIKETKRLVCSEEENWVTIVNGTYRFSPSAKQKYGKILCEAITLVRKDEFTVVNGTIIKPLNDGDAIQSDFSEVHCEAESGKVFKTILSGVLPTEIIKSRPVLEPQLMNILMFGFDSVSRMSWLRNLPETNKYFTTTLGGVVLERYNILGDGTIRAILPILTGKLEPELPDARRGHPAAKPLDGHPWIWKNMTKLGYVTQWGEDTQTTWGTFTYSFLGFDEPPVDHYMRPFYLHAEKQYEQHEKYCLGSIPRHVNMFNWIKELYRLYPDRPKFSFLFHGESSHDTVAYGELGFADLDLKAFLDDIYNAGYLNNTVLILMADHGPRFHKILESSTQGKYEERMPYFGFRFPDWFQKEHPEAILNLKRNQHRLTTPYDIHETLLDIINTKPKVRNKNWTQPRKDPKPTELSQNHSTGISILRVIPENRQCSDAGIAPHWCTCMQWVHIPTSDNKVRNAANQLISTINNILKPYKNMCEEISLNRIISSVQYRQSNMLLKLNQSQEESEAGRIPKFATDFEIKEDFYQITIEALPAYAKFEATIKLDVHLNKYSVSEEEISRINRYSDQPKCVQDNFPFLRPYCFCKVKHSSVS